MRFDIITIFPEMFSAIKDEGVIARGIKDSFLSIHTWQLRDFTKNRYRNVDDRPYGGGPGMVMQVQPIRDCIGAIKKETHNTQVIYLSPQGRKLDQGLISELLQYENITLLCGRYEGIDQRVIDHDVDMEVSIGDYVISGGELAAMVLIDSMGRQVKGVLGNSKSTQDSFFDGNLEYPQYSRPEEIDRQKVPDVLLSGHQKNIDTWREEQSKLNTSSKRKDLLNKTELD